MENLALAEAVLAHLEEHPGEHDQSMWGKDTPCGTIACIAGRAMLLTPGYSFTDGIFYHHGHIVSDEGREAFRLLGLTDDEYYGTGAEPTLFGGTNAEALGRLRHVVEAERSRRAVTSGGEPHAS